jgi:uncharacterized protein
MTLLVTNIPWTTTSDPREEIARRLGCGSEEIAESELLKRSVDGRRRPPVWLANYRVVVKGGDEEILQRKLHGVRAFTPRDIKRYKERDFSFGTTKPWPEKQKPIVVGAGPAGLFAALRLAEAGAPVRVLERGGTVQDRHLSVRGFWRHGKLDEDCNVVFGEGGAGAFSDGKIYTRRRDGDLGWVFQRLVDFGADEEILEEGWAHLGTDKIREILPRIRARIIELGGSFLFGTKVVGLIVEHGQCKGVTIQNGAQLTGAPVIMATGHSARDSWRIMLEAGAEAEPRPIRIGARVEHPQRLIDMARYGSERGELPAASYRLVSKPPKKKKRGAHTFCMCPGGTIVGASNQPERVVVNGMSYSGRKAFWANSAIIVEVHPSDYDGTDPMAGVRFQDRIEAKAFAMGGGGFKAPAQRVQDYLDGKASASLPRTSFPQGVTPSNLWELFPAPIAEGLEEALRFFGKKLDGFAGKDGVLIAPETRTTAPLRFLRTEDRVSTTLPGLMPIGEGAGYAGGIASAALEGFRAAQSIAERAYSEQPG